MIKSYKEPVVCPECNIKIEYHNTEYLDTETGFTVPANTWVFIDGFGSVEHQEVIKWFRKDY